MPGDEGEAQDGDLVATSVVKHGRARPAARQGEGAPRLGEIREGRQPDRHPCPQHPQRVPAGRPGGGRPAQARDPGGPRGLARPPARHHRPARRQGPRRRRPCGAGRGSRTIAGGFIVTVAIADVAAYVRPGTAWTARRRSAATRSISPTASCRCCRSGSPTISARCGRTRTAPALAVRMVIGADGRKTRHSFHRVMMRSAAKLSYQQAQAAIDGTPGRHDRRRSSTPILKPLWAAYARREKGPRRPRAAVPRPAGAQDPAQAATARWTGSLVPRAARCPQAHRGIHDPRQRRGGRDAGAGRLRPDLPGPRRALAREDAGSERSAGLIGAEDAHGQGAIRPELFNRILRSVDGSEHQLFINEVVLRSQSQAEYAAENYGHFGLNLQPLRPFHLADPPLCRPDRPPRADQRA